MRKQISFYALLIAEAFSISGTMLSSMAIPWLVLTITGSPVLTGLVAMTEMIPYVIAKVLGGPLIDRIGAKKIAVFCDTFSVMIIALIPLLHWMDKLSMPILFPVVFLMGLLRGPADAAKSSLVPDIAELTKMPLERLTGMAGAIQRLASTIGTAGAGALIALMGPSQALAINAIGFTFSALIIAIGIPLISPAKHIQTEGKITSYVKELLEGWHFLRKDVVLVSIVLMVAAINLLDQAFFVVMMPVWAKTNAYGTEMLGIVLAAFSGSSVVGSIIASFIGSRMPRLPVYVIAFLLTGFPRFLVFALSAPLPMVFMTLSIAGLAAGFINPILFAVLFERTPKAMTGRVMSIFQAACFALLPFGGLLGGTLVSFSGLSNTFMAIGVIYLILTLSPLTIKGFRDFGKRKINDFEVS